ncbi:MAG: hypothetical protein LUD72_03180 [Bacteroidales bacterium]|nr:hypothetical protein [Bacteroidales bacterium]
MVNRISYRQYKFFDTFIFLCFLVLFEVINIYAIERWFTRQLFSLSVMLLITLVFAFRWGWLSVIFPVADGVIYCLMEGLSWEYYIVYAIGNAFITFACLLFLAVPKTKWTSRWYLTFLYAIIGYVFLVVGRSVVALFFGGGFLSEFVANLQNEFFNLFFAATGLLVLRMFNPMLEDQKEYCKRVVKERENPRNPDEYHWEGYEELDEEALQKFKEMNEYDKAVYYNRRSSVGDGAGEETDEDDLSKLDG